MNWQLTDDVTVFLAAAGDFLHSQPVPHTILLTAAHAIDSHGGNPYGSEPAYFGWLPDDDARVSAACLRSPPFPLLVTHAPDGAAQALAATLTDGSLPGVHAPQRQATAFADAWASRTGATARLARRYRLYRLGELTPPTPPPGRDRPAGDADREVLQDWLRAFQSETGEPPMAAGWLDDQIIGGRLVVWEHDGVPVSMAGRTPTAAGMARVVAVYTPPTHRGRGYAAAATAAVSGAALHDGARDVLLFTDLDNPTTNALYPRLGYRPVEDRAVMEFPS